VPLAVGASRFLEGLKAGANLNERVVQLRSLLSAPAYVSQARRAALLAGVMALPLMGTLLGGHVQLYRKLFIGTPDGGEH
jgi:hypothetical protein